MTPGKLTPKQALFVAEYLKDLNATQAAIRAGYSEKNARRIGPALIGKSRIQEAIAKAQDKRAAKIGRDACDVLRDIQEVTRAAREEGDYKTALKGLELEGKHVGMFRDRLEVENKGKLEVEHTLGAGIAELLEGLKA